jgi:mono/diheme cytochrome c family protein
VLRQRFADQLPSSLVSSLLLSILFGFAFLSGFVFLCSQASAEPIDEEAKFDIRAFFEKHCLDCHGEDTQEADFRADRLPDLLQAKQTDEDWLAVWQKLKSGEMPPKDEPRPNPDEVVKATKWIERSLIRIDKQVQQTEGRVVLRRLNRVEYENTIRDLFAIDTDLKDLLPEDNVAHGFDNIGEALNLSSVLLERYLEAADLALDAAIVTGSRPEMSKGRFSYLDERRVKDHKSYKPLDDALVFFSAGYSPSEINKFRTKATGIYRIRVSAYAHQSDKPVTFRVYGEYGGAKHLAGYFDVKSTPTVHQFTSRLGDRTTIRVVPYGTGLKKWNEAANETGPGLAVQWVEIEGPLIEQWPPVSHHLVFGDLPIEVVNAEEIKRNRRIAAKREVVSKRPAVDAESILRRLLPKIFRRPVSKETLETYLAIVKQRLDQGGTFQDSVRVGLKAALCSPDFLYFSERRGESLDDY